MCIVLLYNPIPYSNLSKLCFQSYGNIVYTFAFNKQNSLDGGQIDHRGGNEELQAVEEGSSGDMKSGELQVVIGTT